MDHVKKVYESGKRQISGYSYKQAMTDAKDTYAKGKHMISHGIKKITGRTGGRKRKRHGGTKRHGGGGTKRRSRRR